MVRVFAHRGMIGITAIIEDESVEHGVAISPAVINDWGAPGQMGFVCDASKCEFSKEAIDALKLIPKSGDAIGEVDVFGADDGMVVFSWLGPPTRLINPTGEGVDGSRDYSPELLDTFTVVPNKPDEAFVAAVDGMLDGAE